MPIPPTGEQFVLASGDATVTVVEVGGGLRGYRHGDRELLDGYAVTETADEGSRGHVLAPWPNRIADGRYRWDGVEHQLALTEPARATAIHGLLRFVAWTPVDRARDRVALEHLLHPQPGYPFTLRVQVAYELGEAGLRVTTTATNEGEVPLPYGEGHHPYLSAGPGRLLDECTLVVPAATRLDTDARGIPTGASPVAGTEVDLRAGRRIGGLVLDTAFTDLARDDRGLAHVRLTGPDGTGAAVWLNDAYGWLQLYTGDAMRRDRRRRGLAVEPMTCPPNAFATGEGVRRLEPGESATGTWGIAPLG
ncbi:aldose 1-epimerase family protein [Trujillonella humicola]|uniref:aldose 1-epimerase family protein n=1 Tax=Trujillonella humicola TaxID=3383699 RepID=UPI00390606DC